MAMDRSPWAAVASGTTRLYSRQRRTVMSRPGPRFHPFRSFGPAASKSSFLATTWSAALSWKYHGSTTLADTMAAALEDGTVASSPPLVCVAVAALDLL